MREGAGRVEQRKSARPHRSLFFWGGAGGGRGRGGERGKKTLLPNSWRSKVRVYQKKFPHTTIFSQQIAMKILLKFSLCLLLFAVLRTLQKRHLESSSDFRVRQKSRPKTWNTGLVWKQRCFSIRETLVLVSEWYSEENSFFSNFKSKAGESSINTLQSHPFAIERTMPDFITHQYMGHWAADHSGTWAWGSQASILFSRETISYNRLHRRRKRLSAHTASSWAKLILQD